MPQLNKGETFADGQQVTGVRLNNLVDGATILPGIITDQTNLTANTVASGDTVLLHDLSATALREATASDLLNSGLAITTGSITGNAAADLVVTPAVGQKVDIVGNLEAENIYVLDDVIVAGSQAILGDLTVTGLSTFNGTSNFVGPIQVNGVTVTVGQGALLSVVEEDIPYSNGVTANTLHDLFTSASYTKPAGEIWIVEVDAYIYASSNSTNIHYRVTDAADSVNYTSGYLCNSQVNSVWLVARRMYLDAANTHTGVFHFRAKASQNNIAIAPTSTQLTAYPDSSKGTVNKFRIYKYKA